MMIWFAGILQNTCCNNSKKIQQKKHWVVSVMSFNYAHWVSHQCVRYENTQKKHTNLTHLVSGASEINIFIVFGLLRHFFLGWMDAHFLGAPSQDRKWGFSTFVRCVMHFGCVLEETHGAAYSEGVREVRKEGPRNFNIKVNVIELYVFRTW